jgi:hypothetical protein
MLIRQLADSAISDFANLEPGIVLSDTEFSYMHYLTLISRFVAFISSPVAEILLIPGLFPFLSLTPQKSIFLKNSHIGHGVSHYTPLEGAPIGLFS